MIDSEDDACRPFEDGAIFLERTPRDPIFPMTKNKSGACLSTVTTSTMDVPLGLAPNVGADAIRVHYINKAYDILMAG